MAYPNIQYPNLPLLSPTKLDQSGSNYQVWKIQIVYQIHRQGLLGFINGTNLPPHETANPDSHIWRRTDLLLKQGILSRLDHTVAPINQVASKTSRDIWLELENRFQQDPTGPTLDFTNDQHNNKVRDWNEYSPLYRAALHCDWAAAKQIFDVDPGAIGTTINSTQATILHVAVGTGKKGIDFVEDLVTLMPDELIAAKDDIGDTALSIATAVGNLAAATVLVQRMPILLYTPNKLGLFPIHIAAIHAQKNVLTYLISVTKDVHEQNPYAGLSGLALLISAIDAEFFDVSLHLVEKFPYLARLKLSTNSALKIIATKKSVFRPFNIRKTRLIFPSGRREVKPQSAKQEALKLVKCLCKEMKSLDFIEAEDIYRDAILMAAQLDIPEIVEEIVEAFPSAIYCSNPASFQNIFHIAVENRSEHIFNLIYQMSDHKQLYLDMPDICGNNLLHLAAKLAPPHKLNEIPGAALQMQRELQWYQAVKKLVHPHSAEQLNSTDKCPKMIFTEEHKHLQDKAEKWMKITANSFSIITTLIASVMFAASITVPGGNDADSGLPIFYNNFAFLTFSISISLSILASGTSLIMFLDILSSSHAEEDYLYFLPERLIIGLGGIVLSLIFLLLTSCSGFYLVFGKRHPWVVLSVVLQGCYLFWLLYFSQIQLLVNLISSTYGRSIFSKQSNRLFY